MLDTLDIRPLNIGSLLPSHLYVRYKSQLEQRIKQILLSLPVLLLPRRTPYYLIDLDALMVHLNFMGS